MRVTPTNREQTVEINTETFTPKVTSTKDIKTKLFDSKFKNELTNHNQDKVKTQYLNLMEKALQEQHLILGLKYLRKMRIMVNGAQRDE